MACSQTISGIAKDCASNLGGVKRVLIANADDVTAVTLTSNKITAITMASGAKFAEFLFRANTSSLASTWQVNNDNGTNFVQSLLAMVFNRMETSKRVAIIALAQSDCVAIVEDMNGALWYLGYDFPLKLNAGDGNTGTALADRNGYGITLEDNSKELPYEVEASVLDDIL